MDNGQFDDAEDDSIRPVIRDQSENVPKTVSAQRNIMSIIYTFSNALNFDFKYFHRNIWKNN